MIVDYVHELNCAVNEAHIQYEPHISLFSEKFFSLFEIKDLTSESAKKAVNLAHKKLVEKIKSGVASASKNDFTFYKYGCYFAINELSALLNNSSKYYLIDSTVDALVTETINSILKANSVAIFSLQTYSLIDTRVDSDFMSVFGLINSAKDTFPYEKISKLSQNSVFSGILLALSKPENSKVLSYYLETSIDPQTLLVNADSHKLYVSFFHKLFPKSETSAIFYSLAFIYFKKKVLEWTKSFEASKWA